MKKILLALTLAGASTLAVAAQPGGPGCGWGNMVLDGHSGLIPHLGASTTNGTSGNATFGMTSGTNGCDANVPLTYGGNKLVALPGFMEEVAGDMSRGEGDALNALAISFGVSPQDRPHFSQAMNKNFSEIFTSEELSTKDFLDNVVNVLKSDKQLSKYAVQA